MCCSWSPFWQLVDRSAKGGPIAPLPPWPPDLAAVSRLFPDGITDLLRSWSTIRGRWERLAGARGVALRLVWVNLLRTDGPKLVEPSYGFNYSPLFSASGISFVRIAVSDRRTIYLKIWELKDLGVILFWKFWKWSRVYLRVKKKYNKDEFFMEDKYQKNIQNICFIITLLHTY